MVYATLEECIVALQNAESTFHNTLNDFQDRIDQGYAKEMKGDELVKVNSAFESIESILNQLNKNKTRFDNLRVDFMGITNS